jgi:hypothetical protein
MDDQQQSPATLPLERTTVSIVEGAGSTTGLVHTFMDKSKSFIRHGFEPRTFKPVT